MVDTEITGVELAEPDRLTENELYILLTATFPVCVPAAVGAYLTVIVPVAPGSRLAGAETRLKREPVTVTFRLVPPSP